MIGVIQKVLMDMVEAEGGADAVAAVREAAGVPPDRVFRLGVNYDDAECRRLIEAARHHFGMTEQEAMGVYADYFFRDALQRWPTWFAMSKSARELLERQPVIHNCFATGLRDTKAQRAVNDKFRVADGESDELIVYYRSPNRLSTLYVALATWVLRHYGEEATIDVRPIPGEDEAEGEAREIRIRWASGPGRRGPQVENHRVLAREEGTAGCPFSSTRAESVLTAPEVAPRT